VERLQRLDAAGSGERSDWPEKMGFEEKEMKKTNYY